MSGLPNHSDAASGDSMRDELTKLAAAMCDGTVSSADRDRLEELLADEDAQRVYLHYMRLHAGLQRHIRGRLPAPLKIEEGDPKATDNPLGNWVQRRLQVWQRPLPFSLTSAALLVGLLLIAMALMVPPFYRNHVENNSPTLALVARLSDIHEADWAPGQVAVRAGSSLLTGHRMNLQEGFAEITFTNGAVALLEGPAVFTLVNEHVGHLDGGRVVVRAPSGKGTFTIETPSATVVDLGTEFGVWVEDNATEVFVFEGLVEVSAKENDQITDQRRLRPGGTLRVTAGAITDAPDSSAARFLVRSMADIGPAIAAVRANSGREYRIAPTPLGEDAVAHTDRAYEWNGVKAEGMPSYLIGAEYIQTPMDDKMNPDLQLSVLIRRPAMLYLFLPDRSPPPEWVKKNYRRTGDKLGLDNAKERSLEEGPGRSIDFTYDVWEREVSAKDVVQLGAPQDGRDKGSGIYGIAVAVKRGKEAATNVSQD